MSTFPSFARDTQGFNSFAPTFAIDNYSVILTASNPVTLTIPTNYTKWLIVFSFNSGASVWVSPVGTASNPVSSSFAPTFCVLNPAPRTVYANDEISFITTDTTAVVGVSLYALE